MLLPGLNGTDGLFHPLLDCTPENIEVVVVTYPAHRKQSYEQLTRHIEEVVANINTPFVLIGESFSGPLALFVAQKKPIGLLGVILVATFIKAPNFSVGRFLPWRIGFALVIPIFKLCTYSGRKKDCALVGLMSEELSKVSADVMADRIDSIFDVNASQALLDCSMPLIYFRGTGDYVVPRKNLNKIKLLKPSVLVAEFTTRHFILQTTPVEAWAEIQKFVTDMGGDKHE